MSALKGRSLAMFRGCLAEIRQQQAAIRDDFKELGRRLTTLERRRVAAPRSTPAERLALGEWLLRSIKRPARTTRKAASGRKGKS